MGAEPGDADGLSTERMRGLADLQARTCRYFLDLANPESGLVPDSTRKNAPSSIAATGLGLSCLVVACERGWISRWEATRRVLATLRTFRDGPAADGHGGFFYHFLDMENGRRASRSEVSTIDTCFVLAGGLTAQAYFDGDRPAEREVRELADAIYRRVDWRRALAGGRTVSHGWTPEHGFLRARWTGYNEALLLQVLALGSPTHPIPRASYAAWTGTYRWKRLYGIDVLYAGPLFIHQLPHVWIDLREIRDGPMRERGLDYFENSRRATLVQQRYAIRNPRELKGYGEHVWGLSASDGPGPATLEVDGRVRRFWDYRARGVPWGPDDGTLAPWAVAASLPFAPGLVARTLEEIDRRYPDVISELGYKCSFNPTYPGDGKTGRGWVSRGYYGLDQGPVVLMIENSRSGLIWRLMRSCPHVVRGLVRAGFRGGWLDDPRAAGA